MCGICGIYAYRVTAANADSGELCRMRDYIAARGPDGAGIWQSDDQRVVLGHRRLSIIDLSERAAQPMLTPDRMLAVTFNGEIYNYRELRRGLEAKGYLFRSQSDTEVLLHLYADRGEAMVHELRGMFAFALWDARKQALFVARDPYGIKPLYYADDGHTLRFASQVKALLAGGAISRESDAAGWVGFYLFGSVPEPWSSHAAVRALPAGSTLWIDVRGLGQPNHYFSVAKTFSDAEHRSASVSNKEVQAYVRGALLDSVRHHLVADVPVGAFLSAGIDSGALLGLMRDAGSGVLRRAAENSYAKSLLRDTDWASMAHSLEVRVPLVDATLLRALAPISSKLQTKPAKRWLAASPTVPLPRAVLNRAKTGFGTPVQIWLQQDERLHQWRRVPSFTVAGYPWARRWAYQVATG